MPIRRKDAMQFTLCCFTGYYSDYSKQLVPGHTTEEQEKVPWKWMPHMTLSRSETAALRLNP